MTSVSDIVAYVEGLSGHPLNFDEGVHHGTAARQIRGVTAAWMATPNAIGAAGAAGHDLLLAHESLYFPYDAAVRTDLAEVDWQGWQTNRQRRELLDEFKLTFLRVHGSLDEICIFDDFAELLGLGAPVYAERLVKVFDIAPCTLADLVERAKRATGMNRIRVCLADSAPDRFRRIGLAWGGTGLFVNVGYMQKLIEQGCELLIGGESDDYGFRFVQECGVSVIETSHEVSENPGLRTFSKRLQHQFPDLNVAFYENRCPWGVC